MFDGDDLFWLPDKPVQKTQKHQNQCKEKVTENLLEETIKKELQKHQNQDESKICQNELLKAASKETDSILTKDLVKSRMKMGVYHMT